MLQSTNLNEVNLWWNVKNTPKMNTSIMGFFKHQFSVIKQKCFKIELLR